MSAATHIRFPVQPPRTAPPVSKKFSQENKGVNEPVAIFKHVDYQRRGEAKLPHNYAKVAAYVEQNFVISEDFEVSSLYGVHSGSCYERRLIAAYTWGQLNPKPGVIAEKMCVECGCVGHFRDDCAALLQQ